MLQSPKLGKKIGIYISHSTDAVSSVLFIEEIGKPIYFLNKKLAGTELEHPILHKVSLALVHSAILLWHYFQVRTVRFTKYPLTNILQT